MLHSSFFFFLSFQRACAWDRRNVGSVAQQISTPFFLETSPCSLEDFAHFPYRNSGIPPSHQSDGHKTSTPHPLPTTHTAKHSHKCMYTAVNTGHAVYVSLVFYFFYLKTSSWHLWRHTFCDLGGKVRFPEIKGARICLHSCLRQCIPGPFHNYRFTRAYCSCTRPASVVARVTLWSTGCGGGESRNEDGTLTEL